MVVWKEAIKYVKILAKFLQFWWTHCKDNFVKKKKKATWNSLLPNIELKQKQNLIKQNDKLVLEPWTRGDKQLLFTFSIIHVDSRDVYIITRRIFWSQTKSPLLNILLLPSHKQTLTSEKIKFSNCLYT